MWMYFFKTYGILYSITLILHPLFFRNLSRAFRQCDGGDRNWVTKADISPNLKSRQASAVAQMDGNTGATYTITSNYTDGFVSLEFRTRRLHQCIVYIVLEYQLDPTTSHMYKSAVGLHLHKGNLVVSTDRFKQVEQSSHNLAPETPVPCVSAYKICADTQWHVLMINISRTVVRITVDEQSHLERVLNFDATQLYLKEIHLGSPPPLLSFFKHVADTTQKTFRGCMRKITYSRNEEVLSLMDVQSLPPHIITTMSKTSLHSSCDKFLLLPEPQLVFESQTADNAIENFVNFVKPGGYLLASGWSVVSVASLSFKFRTTEKNGLILYASSVNEQDVIWREEISHLTIPGEGEAGYDTIALELRDGRLFMMVNTGSGPIQLTSKIYSKDSGPRQALSDGLVHHVDIAFREGDLQLNVDGKPYSTHSADVKAYKFLNLNGQFYIGGLPEAMRLVSFTISPEVWTARLNKDFIGCFGSLTVDNQTWDMDLETRACWCDGHIERGCKSLTALRGCVNVDCFNGGKCNPGWSGRVCDCGDTNFEGDDCTKESTVFTFNGHQWILVDFGPLPIQSAAENVLIRFRTGQSFGLLFTTSSVAIAASDRFELRFESGFLLLLYDFGASSKRYKHLIFVSDNKWHTVRVQRHERFLNFTVDGSSQVYDIPNTGKFVSHKHIILGQSEIISENSPLDAFPRRALNQSFVSQPRLVFIGFIMKFEFNGVNYLHLLELLPNMSKSTVWKSRIEVTAHKGIQEPLLEFPLKFASQNSYMEITLPFGNTNFILEFWIKVNKNFGIICLFAESNRGTFGLELYSGDLQLVYLDEANTRRTARPKKSGILTDSKWHRIRILKNQSSQQSLAMQIDEEAVYAALKIADDMVDQKIFIAGVPNSSASHQTFANLFQTISGFAGCIASVNVQYSGSQVEAIVKPASSETKQRVINLFSTNQHLIFWHNVEPGCQIRSTVLHRTSLGHCSPKRCQFDGRCVQQLDSTRCDCSMTTYTGESCTHPTATINLFTKPPTSLIFEFKPTQNTTRDQLAFGIQATRRGSIHLIRIAGSGVSSDYIEVSVLPFQAHHIILVRYNMGTGQQMVMQPNVDIADGRYHIVQFVREEGNSILRIDLDHEVTNMPSGQQGKDFNGLKTIQIGFHSRREWKNKSIVKSSTKFEGYLSGLNFNGIELFRVLRGYIIPGVYLREKHNVQFSDAYKPNVDHILLRKQTLEPLDHLDANDMQHASYSDISSTGASQRYHTDQLIYPKTECLELNDIFSMKTCKPVDEDGIIKPLIDFETSSRSKSGRDDQSKPKQPQPNDSGASGYVQLPSVMNIPSPEEQQKAETGSESTNPYSGRPHIDVPDKQLLESSSTVEKRFAVNFTLIASVSAGGICMLIALSCIIYRCMRKDEGTYNVDESLAYTGDRQEGAPSEDKWLEDRLLDSTAIPLKRQCNTVRSNTVKSPKSTGPSALKDNCDSTICIHESFLPAECSSGALGAVSMTMPCRPVRHRSQLVKLDPGFNKPPPSPIRTKSTKAFCDSKECYV